jgi:phospholipid/cholesterol/gamma-HCH transport system permease protein
MAAFTYTVDGSRALLEAQGPWTIDHAADIDSALRALSPDLSRLKHVDIAVGSAERIDTTGAWLLVRTRAAFQSAGLDATIKDASADRQTLIEAVAARAPAPLPAPPVPRPIADALAETGAQARQTGRDVVEVVGFLGEVAAGLWRIALDPRRLRLISIVTHIERAGLQALPIVMLISFLIGAIIAQQGAFQLRRFGAEVFVVNLVGILVLREVGLLLAAIIFAGRSGSAYTAEIGAMKMREEIDALRVIGLNPIEILVIPRLIALVISLPLVTVASNFAALLGGLVACWLYLGIDPPVYIDNLRQAVTVAHLQVGLIKAPFMAMIIGIIACVEGLKVQGSTDSLGRHTTASVVKAIFMVIVLDGIFAIVFASLNI